MASTLTAATMTVTHTEAVSLNGYDQGSKNTLTIDSVAEISKRIVTVTTTEAEILAFGIAASSGTFIAADVRYIRFTNLDDTNHLTLTFKDENNTEFRVKLDKGQSFVYNADTTGGVASTMKASGSALASGIDDLVNVTADADTASCDLELFIASV